MPELPDSDSVCRVVIDAAQAASLDAGRAAARQYKDDGSVVTSVDLRIQEEVVAALQRRWPQFEVLGEEMEHARQARILATGQPGVWSLDPLDGTTNFASGFPFFGISIALIVDQRSQIGVVYDPNRRECFHARRGEGAFLNGQRLQTPRSPVQLAGCVANVDYKRLVSTLAERLVRSPPYGSQRNLGSSVLEWCWLAAGRFQLYLHGGQRLWDFAAGSLILTEAGGSACSIHGDEIDGRSLSKRSVVAAVNPALFDAWYAWVADTLGRPQSRGVAVPPGALLGDAGR